MIIQRICRNEPDGKTVDLGGTELHFKPNKQGDNVCEVTDKVHLGVLLAIKEGYQIYDPDAPKPVAAATPPDEAVAAVKPSGTPLAKMNRKQLDAEYKRVFKTKAPANLKDAAMVRAIAKATVTAVVPEGDLPLADGV